MAVASVDPPDHRHPLLACHELGDEPGWLSRGAPLPGPGIEVLGATGDELWVAGREGVERRALEVTTGHPVHLYRVTSAELALLLALRAGFPTYAAAISRAVLAELPGGAAAAPYQGGAGRDFEAWLAALPGPTGASPSQVGESLSLVTGVPFIRLDEFAPSASLVRVIGEEAVLKLRALPIHHDGRTLYYATPTLPIRSQSRAVARAFDAAQAAPLLCSPAQFAGWSFSHPPPGDEVASLKRTLVAKGVLAPARLRGIEKLMAETGGTDFSALLLELGVLSPTRLLTMVSELLGLPVEVHPAPDPALCGRLTSRMMRALDVVLLSMDDRTVRVATSHRPDSDCEELIERLTGRRVEWRYSTAAAMRIALEGDVCGPPSTPPDAIELGCQVLGLDFATRSAIRRSDNPWKELAPRAGTRPRLVSLAGWAFGVPAIRELPGRLRKTDGDSGALFLDYPGDEAWRPALEPDELADLALRRDGLLAFRPVVVSHSHPNGGRDAPQKLVALLDRMEAAGTLPRGVAEAILLRVCQDGEPVDVALLESGVEPSAVGGWLAAGLGSPLQSLEPTYVDEKVIDSIGREAMLTRRVDPLDPDVVRLLPAARARQLGAIPIRREGDFVIVAVADPWAEFGDELNRNIDAPLRLVVAMRSQIERAIDRVGGRRLLGQMLISWGLSADEVNTAVELQRQHGIRLGQAVVSLGLMTELDIADLVAEQLQLPLIDPEPGSLDSTVVRRLPEELCRRHRLVPVHEDAVSGLLVAMADPLDPEAVAAVAAAHDGAFHRAVTTEKVVTRILAEVHSEHYLDLITDELVHFSPENSARWVLTARQKLVLAAIGLLVAAGLAINWLVTLIVLNAVATTFYMVSNLLKVWLMNVSLGRSPEIDVTLEEVEAISEAALPIFTILVPMYREANVLPLLLDGLRRLDYPAGKLDVKLVLEPDDEETQLAVRAERLPSYVEILVVPEGLPKGKPKACNYGLVHARGEYVVIYDAEDRPERDQLRKVVAAFRKAPPELVCIQAKLNYFNRRQNVLTRWFTAEYSLWFDLLLPSIYSLSGPVPLGGTSNHFITDRLRAAGAWDPYNVTEDADLGLRIHKRGWSTAIVNSTTYEEANSDVYNWIRQRSRWVKGYIQTWLVHMRHPVKLWRQLGWRGFLIFQVMIGGTVFSFLVNPIYWALTTIWFLFHVTFVQDIFPPVLFYIGAAGLYVGNFAFTFASLGGCLRRGYYDEVKYALLTPAYWFLMSVAAWKGFIQLFYRPFYWEKTIHGLSLGSEVEPD